MPRRPAFSHDEQGKILTELDKDLQADMHDRQSWLNKRTLSIEDWMAPEAPSVNYPWDDASNITPPIIAKAVRTVFPRIANAFFGADPFVHVTPVDPQNREDAEAREAYLNYVIKNDIPDFYREVSAWLLDHIVHGTSALMVWWEQKEELAPIWKIVDAEVPNPVAPEETVRLTDRLILVDEFGEIDPGTGQLVTDFTAKALGGNAYNVKYKRDGFDREARVTIDRKDVGLRSGQASLTIEETRHTGRVRVKVVDIEDLIAPASSSGFQPEQASHVFRTYWQYDSDIEERMKDGEFFNLNQEDIARLQTLQGDALSQSNAAVKETKDALDGVSAVGGLSGYEQGMIRVVDCHYPWKINGRTVEMIFYWVPALKKLAGWEYSTVKFRHGRRPFVVLPFIAMSNRMYGIGLADLLANIQSEAKVIFNQMNNREDLTNNPVMLVEQNAGVNPNVFRQLPPGSTVTVRNVERIRPLEWSKNPHSGLPIMQNLFAFGEQLAGVGDLQQGVQPNRPNAPRTARGTMALISEGNIILDTHVMTAQDVLKEVVFQIDALLAQYMPEEVPFAITGKREVQTIRRKQLQTQVKFFFTGNTVNTNSQQQQGVAQFLYQNLVQIPFFTGQYLQMPPTSITSLYRLVDYFTKMHLPGKDASFVLPPLEELLQTAQQFQETQAQGMQQESERELQIAEESEDRDFDIEEAKAATGMMKVFADMQRERSAQNARRTEGATTAQR